jgi:uncharacterized repeat protein (TIGR02543 family)
LPESKISKPDNPSRSGYSFDEWHKNSELTDVWNFDNDVVVDNITLYAKWTNIPSGEVEITDCVLGGRDIFITYKLPDDDDLDHLVVYVNGKLYYDRQSKYSPTMVLQNTLNGSLITIKTVDTAGLESDGIDYTVNFPGVIIVAGEWPEILPSVDVIRKYSDRTDPPTISFTFRALTIDGYVILENPPSNWALLYRVSTQSVIDKDSIFIRTYEYTGPVVIDSSWTWIELLISDGLGPIASKEIPIVSE